MRSFFTIGNYFVLLVAVAGFEGCNRTASEAGRAADEHAGEAHDHEHGHAHDDHGHGEEGPHGGHIIELGTEEHHAELTHDDATHKVGVHVLGSDAKSASPIDATSVTVNVSADGQPAQYILPAVPQAGEPAGQSSYFELVSEPLSIVVSGKSDKPNTNARINVAIGGQQFVGMIETSPHEHDHDHGHEEN
jgi:hypothetical protein